MPARRQARFAGRQEAANGCAACQQWTGACWRVGEYPRAEESPEQFHSTDRDAQMAFWSSWSWPSAGRDEKRDKHSSDLAGAVVLLLATHKKEVLNVRGLGLAFGWPWPAWAETSKSLKE